MSPKPFLIVLSLAMISALASTAGCGPTTLPVSNGAGEESFIVRPPMARYLRDLGRRERREQVRDWALIGTVAHLGATPAQAAAATYQIPPARIPDREGLYPFEHGRGRRAYLEQRVLLFRDGDDPDPRATLGRLADRVRMENGELPPAAEVYIVHDLRDDGLIRIDRARDVTQHELLSSAYGYVEGEVSNAASLTGWLDRVDDLTFAQVTDDGRLRLGGRRFQELRTANTRPDVVVEVTTRDAIGVLPDRLHVRSTGTILHLVESKSGSSSAIARRPVVVIRRTVQ